VRAQERLFVQDFDLLTRTPVTFCWNGVESVLLSARHPLIQLDDQGQLQAVHWDDRNMRLDHIHEDADPDRRARKLRALNRFAAVVADSQRTMKFRLDAGDLLLFHNRRMLHGRTAFSVATGNRALHGCYLDEDALQSARRNADRANLAPMFQRV
jgi:alpha-ketoglutarate-dependent taurine dioxygenase